MSENKVNLRIGADTSEIEKAFGSLIRKIQGEADKLKIGGARGISSGGALGGQEFRETLQFNRMKAQERVADQAALNIANSALRQKNLEIEKLSRKQKDALNDKKAEAYYEEQINKAQKERQRLQETADRLQKESIRSYKELFSSMRGGFKSGGIGGMNQVWQGMSGTERMGFGATSLGGLLGVAGAAANYIGQRPIDIARMNASAISMTTGRQLGEARSGEYTFQGMYGEDRTKAQEQASSSNRWKTAGDIGLAGAGLAAVVGSAFLTGGASLLALGAGGALLKSSFMDKGMLDPSKYSAYRSQREATDFTTLLAASQESSPFRKDAIERLKATGTRDLGMQRTLGLNDAGYYSKGGYLQSQMGTDFTDEMVTRSSQGILGAGGSSAMARNSRMSLQAERGLGLTNADQLLGQLSGTQSIPETSKKALIDIFAHGFDSSNYAEENRKYMQAVTEQVYKGGTTSLDATDKIADMIRSTIMGTPTTRTVEAGKTAFEAFQTASTATSGYLGGINVSSAMQDADLRKIKDPAELNALLKLKPNEIDETDADLVASARKMGLTGPELAKKLRSRQIGNVKNAIGGRTGMAERGMISTLLPGLGAPEQKAFANLINQEPSQARDQAIQNFMTQSEKKMATADTGKAGDMMIQASSKNAQISLETLAASISKFAEDAMKAATRLSGEASAGRASEASKFGKGSKQQQGN